MKTVADLIDRNAAYFPQEAAYVLDGRRLSYGEYAERARRLAESLYRLGLRAQDRVGILSTNNIEYFEIYGACALAGYIAAVYNFRSAAPEVAHLLKDSSPRAVFFESQFAGLIDSLRAQFSAVDHWVCIDDAPLAWTHSYSALIDGGNPDGPPIRSRADDMVYLFYTSGTTGAPKGVPWHHDGAMAMARFEGRVMGAGVRLLLLTPAFHVAGCGFSLGAAWLGGTVVLDRAGFDAGRFLRIVERERITDTFMVPPMIQAALDHLAHERCDISSLRSVMAASTAIPSTLLQQAVQHFGPVFFTAYGATEAGDIAAMMKHEMQPDGTPEQVGRLASVGRFHPEIDAIILDEDCRPCAAGAIGEICLKSPVFRGYWNNTTATIEATRGGWFHTGDLGYQDAQGFVFLVDRKKDMIISGGENIYSREVEEALYRHPAVREVAVIGVAHAKWGEAVKAVVVLHPGQPANADDLTAHCREQIARFKCPVSYEFVAEFPRLGSGKIDKAGLRRRFAAST